jgi:2,3,4,5-tetrahydropyridine-2-carboxylate N-succinyltransferase
MQINNKSDFNDFAKNYWKGNPLPFAFALGRQFRDAKNKPIAVRWLTVNLAEKASGALAVICEVLKLSDSLKQKKAIVETLHRNHIFQMMKYFAVFSEDGENHPNIDALRILGQDREGTTSLLYIAPEKHFLTTEPISGMEDAHFRLGLVSHRLCLPGELRIKADEMMPKLQNLAWYPGGVMTIEEWNKFPLRNTTLLLVDKLPPYTWAMPLDESVRILNPLVRFGAYLGSGTTVMPYGWVNFNAGIMKGMVEGRIPAGVMVGSGTDIGAGAGILGTMSGGNQKVITIGNNCLLEANCEVGISLGNNCRVCMNTCVHANTPVIAESMHGSTYHAKAREFDGIDNITIRTNSLTGRIEVFYQPNSVKLNEVLHDNVLRK